MPIINIYEAKRRLSQLVDRAASGEDIVIGRGGKPVAKITRLSGDKREIRFGVLKGKLKIAHDFDAPLPTDVQAAFEGR